MMYDRRFVTGFRPLLSGLLLVALLAGCEETLLPEPSGGALLNAASAPAPSPLVTVTAGGEPRTLWPFTGSSVGADAQHQDPINLIFVGHADPLSIRAALLELDGNRPAFPPFPFFQCTWDDAMGANQAGYAEPEGWSGSAVQLECGSYAGLRFHLRLFKVGNWTVGNAHFETVIPGTHDHQVLSWELGEQFVAADLARAQLLASAPTQTEQINPQPSFKTIHPLLYWSPQMTPLHPLINAVVVAPQTIGIRTDGRATVLDLARTVPSVLAQTRQELVIEYGQIIPKPFCATPLDYVFVQGPITLRQDVSVSAAGVMTRQFHASAELTVTPVDPRTQQPIGPSSAAQVNGLYRGMMGGGLHSASNLLNQVLTPEDQPTQRSMVDLQVGPNGVTRYQKQEQCG